MTKTEINFDSMLWQKYTYCVVTTLANDAANQHHVHDRDLRIKNWSIIFKHMNSEFGLRREQIRIIMH